MKNCMKLMVTLGVVLLLVQSCVIDSPKNTKEDNFNENQSKQIIDKNNARKNARNRKKEKIRQKKEEELNANKDKSNKPKLKQKPNFVFY